MQVRPADADLMSTLPRQQHQLEDGPRAPKDRLGTTMMRRMIGRDKGFRCVRANADMAVGDGAGDAIFQVRHDGLTLGIVGF